MRELTPDEARKVLDSAKARAKKLAAGTKYERQQRMALRPGTLIMVLQASPALIRWELIGTQYHATYNASGAPNDDWLIVISDSAIPGSERSDAAAFWRPKVIGPFGSYLGEAIEIDGARP